MEWIRSKGVKATWLLGENGKISCLTDWQETCCNCLEEIKTQQTIRNQML